MDISKKVSKILKTKTITHSSVTILGTACNGILGILFFIFLARILGAENFGIFSISIIVLTMVSDIADLGVNTGLINFVSRQFSTNPKQALRFLKLGLTIKILISIIVLITGFFLAPFIAGFIFLKPELTTYLRLSFIGVGGAMLFSFSINALQAMQQYKAWALINILSNSIRLLAIVLLAYVLILDVGSALLAYIILPYFGFLVSLFFLPPNFLLVKDEKVVFKEFFHYNKWVAVSILVAAISSRLDTFFVARLLSIEQTGYYSIGVQLSSILPQFTFAIASVIAPKIASYSKEEELFVYLKKIQLFALALASLGFILSPLAFILIPLIYGAGFNLSIWPFLILFYSQLIFLLSIPSHQAIFYGFSKPKIFVFITSIIMIILIFLNLHLIPKFGIIGAATAVLIGSFINFIVPTIYVYKKIKKI